MILKVGLLVKVTALLLIAVKIQSMFKLKQQNRRKIVITNVLIQAFLWLPIMGLSLLAWNNILQGFLPYLLIILYSFIAIVGGIAHPSWFSWMGDLVPEKERGK